MTTSKIARRYRDYPAERLTPDKLAEDRPIFRALAAGLGLTDAERDGVVDFLSDYDFRCSPWSKVQTRLACRIDDLTSAERWARN